MIFAMTHAGYVAVGWIVPLAVLAGYAAHLVRRGKAMSRRVPAEERRWS